jgi:hypothetical protein
VYNFSANNIDEARGAIFHKAIKAVNQELEDMI